MTAKLYLFFGSYPILLSKVTKWLPIMEESEEAPGKVQPLLSLYVCIMREVYTLNVQVTITSIHIQAYLSIFHVLSFLAQLLADQVRSQISSQLRRS